MIPFEEGRSVGHVVDLKTGCWIWTGYVSWLGYGMVGVAGERRIVYAHRAYYEREHGPIPDGLELDHLCRVRACVNPSHLEAVTHVENCRRGSMTKISDDNVRAIRKAEGTHRELAQNFGVATATIQHIKSGRSRSSVRN